MQGHKGQEIKGWSFKISLDPLTLLKTKIRV